MAKKVVKITTEQLRQIVLEEKARIERRLSEDSRKAKAKRPVVREAAKPKSAPKGKAPAGKAKRINEAEKLVKDPKEVQADGYADTLEKEINYMKALKIKEQRAKDYLTQISETQDKVRTRILKRLK